MSAADLSRYTVDRAALLPEVVRRLFGEPRVRDGGDTWRYGTDELLEVHVSGPRRGTWFDHKAGVGGDVLDLVKHVLRRDEENAVGWMKEQDLIGRPRASGYDPESAFFG